jgi:predicted O-methyltransferase YrrM
MEAIQVELSEHRDAYNALVSVIGRSIKGRVCHHHVVVLNALVNLFPISVYLEIGVHNGTSMSYVVNQATRPLFCVGVDLFSDTTARYTHDKLQQERTEASIQANNTSGSTVRLIKGNSRASVTYDSVVGSLAGNAVDLLFIDGDHEFAGVESDFLMYSGLVRKGGFVVFDDANIQYPGIL